MKNIHIVSVGASIITNYNRHPDRIDLPPLDEDAKFENIWTDKSKFNLILKFAIDNIYKASAELNALKEFIDNNIVQEVHLIVTDTFVGKITSEIIKKILSEKSIICSVKIIPGYYKEKAKNETEAETKFTEGLVNLRDSLINYLKNKRENEPDSEIMINATGGFKPEILILMLVGSIYNCKVYYIHEFFKRIIFLPPIFLPFINENISNALKEISQNISKRISGENLCNKFKSSYSEIYDQLLNFRLISEKYGESDGILFEIKQTEYGNLLSDLCKK